MVLTWQVQEIEKMHFMWIKFFLNFLRRFNKWDKKQMKKEKNRK